MSQSKVRYQWQKLYYIIKSELVLHGEESWLGDKDFWIVDDFSETAQKVILSNWKLFRPDIARRLQAILKRTGGHWHIKMQVDTHDLPEDIIVGVLITSQGVEEYFDREHLPPELRNISFQE